MILSEASKLQIEPYFHILLWSFGAFAPNSECDELLGRTSDKPNIHPLVAICLICNIFHESAYCTHDIQSLCPHLFCRINDNCLTYYIYIWWTSCTNLAVPQCRTNEDDLTASVKRRSLCWSHKRRSLCSSPASHKLSSLCAWAVFLSGVHQNVVPRGLWSK